MSLEADTRRAQPQARKFVTSEAGSLQATTQVELNGNSNLTNLCSCQMERKTNARTYPVVTLTVMKRAACPVSASALLLQVFVHKDINSFAETSSFGCGRYLSVATLLQSVRNDASVTWHVGGIASQLQKGKRK